MYFNMRRGTAGYNNNKNLSPCCGLKIDYDMNIGWVCNKCKKHYLTKELVTPEEYKNINRIRIIKKN